MRPYEYSLRQHDLLPPAAERLEAQEAIVLDHGHHETDLVHVARDQHARCAVFVYAAPTLYAHDRAEIVGDDLAVRGEIARHDLAHRAFLPGHSWCLGQLFH